MYDECLNAIVIDNGSSACKIGFAGEEKPRNAFPTVVGRHRKDLPKLVKGLGFRERYVGSDVQGKRGILALKHPIECGIITDWDDMQHVWEHGFYNEMRVAPEEAPVLLTEPALNPKVSREKMAQIMFETLNVPALYIGVQPRLSLIASGRASGIVVESGEGLTQIAATYESCVLPLSSKVLKIAGGNLTNYLMKMLLERTCRHHFTSDDKETVQSIKEKLSYTARDIKWEQYNSRYSWTMMNERYTLPDGESISLGDERFWCGEAMFQPSLAGVDSPGIHEAVSSCLQQCGINMRKDLLCNVILSGGTTMMPGIADRLQKELTDILSPYIKIKVIAPPERKYSTWIGGSIISSLSSFQETAVNAQEYKEHGPGIVHQKCY